MSARTAVAAAEPPPRPERRLLTAVDLTVRDAVWVFAFGRWCRGEVIGVARVRVQVRYVDGAGTRRERWFAASPTEPVISGALAAPLRIRCRSGRCGAWLSGVPGQSQAEIRRAHESSREHFGEEGS